MTDARTADTNNEQVFQPGLLRRSNERSLLFLEFMIVPKIALQRLITTVAAALT